MVVLQKRIDSARNLKLFFECTRSHCLSVNKVSFVFHSHYFWTCDDQQNQAPPLWLLAKISHTVIILFFFYSCEILPPAPLTPQNPQNYWVMNQTRTKTTRWRCNKYGTWHHWDWWGDKNRLACSLKLTFSVGVRLSLRPFANVSEIVDVLGSHYEAAHRWNSCPVWTIGCWLGKRRRTFLQ